MAVETRDVTLTPVPLMQLSTAFWAFKTLAAAHELDLFTRLSGSGTSVTELARELEIEERPAEMLLTGCTSLGLLERGQERYVNSPLAEEFLVRGRPYYFGGFVQMLDNSLYPGWDKLVQALRTNRPTTWDPDSQKSLFEGEDPAMLALFWEAMHSLSTFTARVLGEAVDLSGVTRLLDVGGGSGAFDIELCRRYPNLHATVFDLPFVAEIAARKVEEAGLSDRIATAGGDFFAEPLPSGHDAVLMSMILHDWSEERNREILRRFYAALPSGGTIIINELLVNDEKTGPPPAALMSLNMLIETEGGRNYTPGRVRTLARGRRIRRRAHGVVRGGGSERRRRRGEAVGATAKPAPPGR